MLRVGRQAAMVGFMALAGSVLVAAAGAKEWPTKVPNAEDRGRELYERHCVACHGAAGAGDGLMGLAVGGVPDLKAGYGDRDVDDLVAVVLRGRGKMPGFETAFDSKDARKVVDYLGKLGSKPPKPKEEAPANEDDDAGDADIGG